MAILRHFKTGRSLLFHSEGKEDIELDFNYKYATSQASNFENICDDREAFFFSKVSANHGQGF